MIRLEAIGTVGKDAIVNTVNDKKVINFSIAVNEKLGNGEQKTTWVECAKWGEKTAVAEYIKKGGKVFVDGTPEIHTYTKQDGTTSTSLRLRVASIELLGSNQQQQHTTQDTAPAYTPSEQVQQKPIVNLDDLPF